MSKTKMRLPRSVATSRRRSGITRMPLGQARPRAETTVTQSAGSGIPGAVTWLVVVLITLTALLFRSGKYRLRRAASKERMSEPSAVAGVQPGTVATPTNCTPGARGTVAWSSTLDSEEGSGATSVCGEVAVDADSLLMDGALGPGAPRTVAGPASNELASKSTSRVDDRYRRPASRQTLFERRIAIVPPPRTLSA